MGAQLCQLVVHWNENIVGFGDDLRNYFYMLKHNPAWLERNAFGEEVDGTSICRVGGTGRLEILPMLHRGVHG